MDSAVCEPLCLFVVVMELLLVVLYMMVLDEYDTRLCSDFDVFE